MRRFVACRCAVPFRRSRTSYAGQNLKLSLRLNYFFNLNLSIIMPRTLTEGGAGHYVSLLTNRVVFPESTTSQAA